MKAMVPSSLCGFGSAVLALPNASASGPCGSMQLWSEKPPGTKLGLSALGDLASYWPYTRPMNPLMMFM